MHELGVTFYVIKEVNKVAHENAVGKVNAVTVEIGELSGVIHDYLQDCWKWAIKREPVLTESELRIETIPAVTFCEDCKSEYSTVEHAKVCPNCGSENTYLLRGTEFMVKEIEVDEDSVGQDIANPNQTADDFAAMDASEAPPEDE